MATSQVPSPSASVSRWRKEPFRIFFPLGVLFAWIGVGHWLVYATGITATYSCKFHGLVQTQAFLMAFAAGFLLTALPSRTRSPAASRFEIVALALTLVVTTAAAIAELWIVSEAAYACVFIILAQFALRRFAGQTAGRRPPAAFVLVPIAALQGFAGASLMIAAEFQDSPVWTIGMGRLLIEQGVFLCLAVGVGGLILPLIAGASPPADLGSSPRESRKAIAYAICGLAIVLTFVLEQAGYEHGGPVVRAVAVALGLALGAGALRGPGKPGVHRRFVWLSVWLMPIGLLGSGIWPDYRVPLLHILFIGGFALLAFSVASHVALGHLNMPELALGRPPAVIALGAAFLIALVLRVMADATDTYFSYLGWASAIWIIGSAVWLAFFAPKLIRN